jgi:hypothetical protein
MRILLLSLGLLAFGSSARAQQLAEVTVIARVRIPDYLTATVSEVSESIIEAGKRVRRVTLRVNANRAWTLSVVRTCIRDCSEAEFTVSAPAGPRGQTEVVVEYRWNRTEAAPSKDDFQYVLAAR